MTDLAQGTVIARKYRLERLIGRGGMGSVWAARHLQLQTEVALKFVDTVANAADAHVRFEREARAAAQLRSPHVVQILDHGVDGGQPYIAMELLEGEDLGDRLRRVHRLSLMDASRIFSQAAKALRRAHDAGVIHRDLKPSNIFLARFDEDEVVKLLDFGVAKLRQKEMDPNNPSTQAGVVFGSPSYMSPEQARANKPIDHRSDLWSIAVILFRALTGVKPFEASSIGDLVIKLCIDPAPVPSRIAPDLPPAIDRFFERAFARDPEQRYQSAMTMAADFEAIARQHAPSGAPEPPAPLAARSSATPPSGVSASFSGPVILPQGMDVPIQAAPAPEMHPRPRRSCRRASQRLPRSPLTCSRLRANPSPRSPLRRRPRRPSQQPCPRAPGAFACKASPTLFRAQCQARSWVGTGRYNAFPVEPQLPLAAPPSMTPSPALMAPRAMPAEAPDRKRLMIALGLGAGALVLLVITIGALRSPPTRGSAPAGSDEKLAGSSASTAELHPAPIVIASAAPSAEPAAPASAAPSASSAEPPSASATAEPSAKVKGPPGKGRGRVPNFGY